MSSNVVEISAEKKIAHAKELMKIKKISGIPVVDENKQLIGIISIEDIIHALEFNKINDPIRKHHDHPGRHHPQGRFAGRGGGQVRELQVRPLPGGRRRQPRLRHHQQGRHPARHPGEVQPHLHPRPEAHQHPEHRVLGHHRREAEGRGGQLPLPHRQQRHRRRRHRRRPAQAVPDRQELQQRHRAPRRRGHLRGRDQRGHPQPAARATSTSSRTRTASSCAWWTTASASRTWTRP